MKVPSSDSSPRWTSPEPCLDPFALAGLLAAVGATASYHVVAILLLCLAAILFATTPTRASTHRQQQQAPLRREVLNSSAFLRVVLLMVAVSIPFLSFRALWDRYTADIGEVNWLVGLSYLLGGLCYAVLSPVGGALFARRGSVLRAPNPCRAGGTSRRILQRQLTLTQP